MSASVFAKAYGGAGRASKKPSKRAANQQPKGAPQTRKVTVRRVAAKYDAAQTTADNRRHWANADSLGPNAALSPEVRRKIRDRARYEVANNSFAKGIALTLVNDTVGTGPRLQMLTDNAQANRLIEELWCEWACATNFATKLRVMRGGRVDSGESFGMFISNEKLPERLGFPIKLDLRLIEPDQVTSQTTRMLTPGEVDGIRFDKYGNPVEYHVLRHHPGELWNGIDPRQVEEVPASAMIHYFRPDRPGQARGLPDITPALPLFAQLRRYTLAVIAAAETAADYAAVIYSEAPADGESDDAEPFDEVELAQRMATIMPKGWKLGQIKAEQPTTTYVEFTRAILKEIARCLNMPYNIAAGDSSDYNYASGRLDHQSYFKATLVEQRNLELVVLDRVFHEFLNEAVLIEGLLPQSMRTLNAPRHHTWFWDGREHVDPLKEASAQRLRLGALTTSLAREYAKEGKDWETELEQIAKERQKLADLGLSMTEALNPDEDINAPDTPGKPARTAPHR